MRSYQYSKRSNAVIAANSQSVDKSFLTQPAVVVPMQGVSGGGLHLHGATLRAGNPDYLKLGPDNFTIRFAARYSDRVNGDSPREAAQHVKFTLHG